MAEAINIHCTDCYNHFTLFGLNSGLTGVKAEYSFTIKVSFQIFTLSGLCSGLTEAVVINPFEVVKVKLQAERNVFKEVSRHFDPWNEIILYKDCYF